MQPACLSTHTRTHTHGREGRIRGRALLWRCARGLCVRTCVDTHAEPTGGSVETPGWLLRGKLTSVPPLPCPHDKTLNTSAVFNIHHMQVTRHSKVAFSHAASPNCPLSHKDKLGQSKLYCWKLLPRLILRSGSLKTISDSVQILIVCIDNDVPVWSQLPLSSCTIVPTAAAAALLKLLLNGGRLRDCTEPLPPANVSPSRVLSAGAGLAWTCCASVCDHPSVTHLIAASSTIWWDEALSWGGKCAGRRRKKKEFCKQGQLLARRLC